MAYQVFCRSCGFIQQVCRTGQWWKHRKAAQIPGFTKSVCICNYTQCGWDRLKSYNSKLCGNNTEVLHIEWAAGGICMSCPAKANPSTTNMVTQYGSWRLLSPYTWCPSTLCSGPSDNPAQLDQSTKHHDVNDILDSGDSWGPYQEANREWAPIAVRWTIIIDC